MEMRIKFKPDDVKSNQQTNELIHIIGGFWICLQRYGIWKNGVRYIGCLDIPIREALENEVSIHFITSDVDAVVWYIMDCFPDKL